MSQPVIRLSSTHKRLIYLVFALLWMSGALWLLSHYFFAIEGDFGPTPHPLEKWALRLHGFTAMLALIAVGSLATHHMRLAWSRKQNHRSGMAMFTLNAWLAATGYALYYFATDDNAAWLSPTTAAHTSPRCTPSAGPRTRSTQPIARHTTSIPTAASANIRLIWSSRAAGTLPSAGAIS